MDCCQCFRCGAYGHEMIQCSLMMNDIQKVDNVTYLCKTLDSAYKYLSTFPRMFLHRYIMCCMNANLKINTRIGRATAIKLILSKKYSHFPEKELKEIMDKIDEDSDNWSTDEDDADSSNESDGWQTEEDETITIPIAKEIYDFEEDIPVATIVRILK